MLSSCTVFGAAAMADEAREAREGPHGPWPLLDVVARVGEGTPLHVQLPVHARNSERRWEKVGDGGRWWETA